MTQVFVNGVERKIDEGRRDVHDPVAHIADHGALWEALIYLNRRVQRLESMLDEEED